MASSRRGAVAVLLLWLAITHGQEVTTEASNTTSDATTTTSSVRPTCAPHTCRMLCPYGFERDDQGCTLCECKNPCKGVDCPSGTECQVDDSVCVPGQSCVPSTNCRKARAVLGECAFGDPLAGVNNRPLLCGTDPDKPRCPSGYDCVVLQDAEYGLCCPQEQQDRAAECPRSVAADFRCDKKCSFDGECDNGMKCCDTSCGKACLSSRNSTVCEQQRRLAFLFSKGVHSPGYIPQCDDDGQFQPMQCSSNEKVCWCVNNAGSRVTGSLGPAGTVNCAVKDRSSFARSHNLEKSHDCSLMMCDVLCENGYKKDDKGCTLCECVDPCESKTCQNDEECIIVKEEPCVGTVCGVSAICSKRSDSGFVCSSGEAQLRENATVNCANAELCDEGFDCEISPGESMGICCRASAVVKSAAPQREDDLPKDKVSTMCEYLRELGSQGENLALPTPKCSEDGKYFPVQCDTQGCFCVDDFGVEIQNSRKDNKTADEVECRQMRSAKPCYNLLCRLGCEFGFEYDEEGCPICACRNPCKSANCSSDEVCQMAAPSKACSNWWCPPVPKCINKDVAQKDLMMFCPGSPSGPFLNADTNDVFQCDVDSHDDDSCPSGYLCVPLSEDAEYGRCCPGRETREHDDGQSSETRQQPEVKSGQCPYLIPFDTPMGAMSCEIQCDSDRLCPGDSKCCSNGCGTQCMPAVQMTGCEHARTLREHQAHVGELRSQLIPSCDPMRRGFEDVQCHQESCWCADSTGVEIPGTRSNGAPTLNCTDVRQQGRNVNTTCNVECNVDCEFGQKLDSKGCPFMCECVNPCDDVRCAANEECRLIALSCAGTQPCPRQAMCRPKVENVCLVGEPLVVNETLITCGPGEQLCPSSHKCQLDILGEFAQCCQKPREVCFGPPPICGRVEHEVEIQQIWFFDGMSRQCQPVPFNKDYCRSGSNLFSSRSECENICPTKTSCETMHELKANEQSLSEPGVSKPVYVPNCDYRLGTWEPVQCLPEVGLCWCVDQQGNQIAGSMVRGSPDCSIRATEARQPIPIICPRGEPVHICDHRELCARSCASQPNATCRVDPCGGCRAVFFDESNNVVDCNKGLTACQEESQMVRNSRAWNTQFFHTISSLIQKVYPENMPQPPRPAPPPPPGSEAARSNSRAKRETPSDEISDYDDPAARAMSAYHQNRRRPAQEPIAELSAPPKIVVPFRAPIIMVVQRPIQQLPSPLELMQSISSSMPRMRLMVQVADEAKDDETLSHENAASLDPAMFMSHVTALMERVMGSAQLQQPPQLPQLPEQLMPQPQGSERIVVGPNFAEVRMTMKSDSPVSLAAMRQVEQGSLNHLLNYLFGHPDAKESRTIEKQVAASQDDCPQGGIAEALSAMIGGCRNECRDTSDCSPNEKCCQYGCSSTCVATVTSELSSSAVKPGHCPSRTLSQHCHPTEQIDRCMNDAHCPGNTKCCPESCGAVCRSPVDENVDESMPSAMYVAPPVCSPDGGYAVSQSQGALSWCVDRYGTPIDATLTKGTVACDVNGTVTKRESVGNVCPGGAEAQVCRDQCVSAVCPNHPFAMCVADPCNNCEIHFLNAQGDKVDCTAVCEQPAGKTSACHENSGVRSRPRYTFNQTSQSCEEFQFDCNGNDNNFDSIDDCQEQCKKPRSVCELPKEPGLCKAMFRVWYYNSMTHQCEEFSYGGCGGNANNFETKAMCDMVCPDMVLCPYDTITKEGLTRKPCDRVSACAATACPGDPTAVCQVDPCECLATWVDPESGEPARCEKESDLSTMAKEIRPKCSTLQKKNALLGYDYVPECESDGSFHPMQCRSGSSKKECWCVDSAGHQIGDPFTDKAKECAPMKITRVDIDVAFNQLHDLDDAKVKMAENLQRALRSIDAATVAADTAAADATAATVVVDDLRVEAASDNKLIHAKFSLSGEQCASIAYKIEQLIMAKALKVSDSVADYSNSKFTYVAEENSDTKNAQATAKVEVIYSADKNEVLAIKRLLEPRAVDARTTTLAAAVLAVTVVVCILLLLTILMHRNQAAIKKEAVGDDAHTAGVKFGGALAFQNPVYVLWTNRVMNAVCRRSPAPSPPISSDYLAQMEAQNEAGIEDIDEVNDEFNNPNYEDVIDEPSVKTPSV